ncbi:MAG: phosphoglucosamine mutase [Gammaproteobacteria bacterium]|jgi:phosphoglucosamine mutase
MTKRYFGTDGIRGKVGEDKVTPEFVLKLGWAAGRVLGKSGGSVLIGKDTRISGYMFESALEAGLAASGMNVLLTGPMPTPGIAYLTQTFHARAGIVISASHNPYYDNGIKFFSGTGQKLPDDVELAIEEELDKPMKTINSESIGRARRITDAAGRYVEFCKSSIPMATSLKGMKVVIDCAHGATYHIAPEVFTELGAKVIAIGADPDGLNINDGVGSTHPELLQARVLEEQADLGVALDGDGDRVLLVDGKGRLVDGDDILYIIARARLRDNALRGNVVGTLMTNLGLELALRELGVGLDRTDVGDRYIIERLQQNQWNLGGEPSGHIICLDRTTTGDGIISALQVIAEVAQTGQPLHELVEGVEKCPQMLINVSLGNAVARDVMQLEEVMTAVRDAEADLGNEGRVLLRPSGTEPLIRVMVEGTRGEQVERLSRQIADVVAASVN